MKPELTPEEDFKSHACEYDEDYGAMHGSSVIPERFGLCSTCDNFVYVMYEHGREVAMCSWDRAMHWWPTGRERIVKCSNYARGGKLSLIEMAGMATYIDPANKRRVGFCPEED